MPMDQIRHLVVLMLENRSFDNMAGYLYAAKNNRPPANLPPQLPPAYDGLVNLPFAPGCELWNPTDPNFFTGGPSNRFYVEPVSAAAFKMPDPDPEELFEHINYQLFGPDNPSPAAPNQMKGFYIDYRLKSPASPGQIMQCYSPPEVPVISALAREYAISDRWFAACPTQTWPNRAFVHLGTSLGKVNNAPYDPFDYDAGTIFNVLEAMRFAPWGGAVTWNVYNDSLFPPLTHLQLPKLWDPQLAGHFHHFEQFKQDAGSGNLPAYSFIEPGFLIDPNDEHPPHDVRLGEQFIHDVWQAVSTGKNWNETLLVITYDEHGGCYDHVAPPFGATPPDQASNPGEAHFGFDRFGVRVPAILVSPWIAAGTVFRSSTAVPYDHTSILATLRDWLKIPASLMLPSRRIAAAPTLDNVLTLNQPRSGLPTITPRPDNLQASRVIADTPLNDLQKSILAALESKRLGRTLAYQEVSTILDQVKTRGQMINFLRRRL